jgi:hypothetical protein
LFIVNSNSEFPPFFINLNIIIMMLKPNAKRELTDESIMEDTEELLSRHHSHANTGNRMSKLEAGLAGVNYLTSQVEPWDESAQAKLENSYFANLVMKMKEVLEQGVLHLKSTIAINYDISLIRSKVSSDQFAINIYDRLKEKIQKIKQKSFNWKVDSRSIPFIKQIFNIVDIFYAHHHFLFIDYLKLQEFLTPDMFICFFQKPYHSFDEEDPIFFEVTEFHSILISVFKKLFISFPMSVRPRLHPGELNLVNPFMRQHYRISNLEYFQKSSGLPSDFNLLDFLTKTMEKFIFSGLPRWEQKSGRPFIVSLLSLIVECFDFGLVNEIQCDLLLSQLYMISELLSSLESQIKIKYTTNAAFVEKYYHEFMQCRISISKIVIHVICVYCDFDFMDSVKQLKAFPESKSLLRYFLQDKRAAYSNISLIVLKYLAPKLEIAKIKEFSESLENNISLIFNFIGDYQNDFFTQSLSLVRPECVQYYLSSEPATNISRISLGIHASVIELISCIRMANTSKIRNLDNCFLELIQDIKVAFEEYPDDFEIRLELSKLNVPSLLLQVIDYMDRTGLNSKNIISEGIISLGLILKQNYPGQSVLFTGHTFYNYQAIFLRRYLVTMNMLQYVFNNDYTMFNLVNRVFMTKIQIYKQLISAFRDQFQKDQTSEKFIDILGSLYFFNLFFENILNSNMKNQKNKKRYDLVIAAEIVNILNDFVFPALFNAEFLKDYNLVNFKNKYDLSDLQNYENVRNYFRSKALPIALFEIYFSFLCLFNKATFFVYSGEVYEKVVRHADISNLSKLPKNFPGEIIIRIEMLKLFERFHVFYTNHLLSKRGLYNSNTKVVIGELFIPLNTYKLRDKILSEIHWFSEYTKISMNTKPQNSVHVTKYLQKGILSICFKYLKGILGLITIMLEKENIQILTDHCNDIVEELLNNSNKYCNYVQNSLSKTGDLALEFKESEPEAVLQANPFGDISSKLAGLFQKPAEPLVPKFGLGMMSNLNSNKIPEAEKSKNNNETTFDSDVLEERINPNLKEIREKILDGISLLKKIYNITGDCCYIINQYTRHTDLDTNDQSSMRNLQSFNTVKKKSKNPNDNANDISIKKGIGIVQQIKRVYRDKKAYFNEYPNENRFVQYLTTDSNSDRYNRAVAEFFIDQMVNMESIVIDSEYERSFYINDIYLQYIITMNNLLSWTDLIRIELHNILYSSKCKSENTLPVIDNLKPGDEEYFNYISQDIIRAFWKSIWGAYLSLLTFVYFKPFTDREWEEYWGRFVLVSELIQNFCENNYIKFKELVNKPGYGMIEKIQNKEGLEPRSVFFENYILMEVLTMNSNFWLNDDKKIVPSDRPEMFPIIRRVMENVSEMLNGPCKANQLQIYTYRIDMWTGIINRVVDDIDSKLYEVKLACINYISALLEGLDNKIVQFMGSNLEVHKLFDLIIVLTKKLYLKQKIFLKTAAQEKDLQRALTKKKSSLGLNKIASRIAILAKNSQHLLEEISSPGQIYNLYNKQEEFSEHIIMNIIISTFVLLKNLSTKIKFYEMFLKDKERIAKNYTKEVKSKEEAVIYNFILTIIVDIEILYKSNDITSLQKFYFKMPPRCFFLTDEMMDRFIEESTIESTTAKRNFLYNNTEALSLEMLENQKNFSRLSSISYAMTNDAFRNYQFFLIILCVLLNIFLLVYLENLDGNGLKSTSSVGSNIILFLGSIIAAFSAICTIVWLIIKYHMEIRVAITKAQALSANDLSKQELFRIYFFKGLLLHPRFGFFFLMFVFTVLGLAVNYVFLTMNLLLLVNISKPINYIMRSIINHYEKLLVTFILTVLVIFAYSFILLYNFAEMIDSDEFGDTMCSTFLACFVNSVNLGLRLDGGIGDSLKAAVNTNDKQSFWARFFFDLTFFILVRLILLNVIAGIIIDTFSDLRDELNKKNNDSNNICYICGINRWRLEQKGVDFDEHIEDDHSMWKYLFFIIKLTLSDQRSFTGIEFYVWEKYEINDASWMPTEIYLKKGENYATVTDRKSEDEENNS